MNAENGEFDLAVLIEVFQKYCRLGPKERVLFKHFVAGDDLSNEDVADLRLRRFSDIIADSIPYLKRKLFAESLLDELEFMLSGYIPTLTEDDYY